MNQSKHNTELPQRRIRSFVRREGRLTIGQRRALDELWSGYGLDFEAPWRLGEIFQHRAPITLEIGFGNGACLAQMAGDAPEANFLGIEVHRPGAGHLLQELQRRQLQNVRVICHDAVEVVEQKIPDASLERVLLFFPDPWPKKKHHKRRIVQPEFISLVAKKLIRGGRLHMATDWQPYAEHMLEVMASSQDFDNCAANGGFSEKPAYRPTTKFERRGQLLGHGVQDLIYQKSVY